jgi:hypothetical protein
MKPEPEHISRVRERVREKGESWPEPVPLANVPEAEPFPVELLPGRLAQFARDAGEALACPVDYLAVPLLAIAGAAIGASRALEIKAGWWERPSLYAAVVGPPGCGKTPSLKLAAGPVYAEQERRLKLWKYAKLAWEESESEEKGPRPILQPVFVSDITTEALAPILQDSPRGVAMIRDELTAWVNSLDQYRARGRGADRQFYLAAWAGEPVSVHRKNQDDGPLFVPHPFLSVAGGLPPDLLERFRGERAIRDGFLDRILFAFPEPPPATEENWRCVSEEAAEAWNETLAALLTLEGEQAREGGMRPRFVHLTADGKIAWKGFTRALANEMNADTFGECLRGPWSKLRSYGARLALIIHLLRKTADETKGEDVDGESMERAAALVKYFQSHARKVYAAMGSGRDLEDARRVLDWIVRRGEPSFTWNGCYRDLGDHNPEGIGKALQTLEDFGHIRERLQDRQGTTGRKPKPAYEVNPAILSTKPTKLTKPPR